MTDTYDNGHPVDEELVAYLDGELSPDERIRIARRIANDHDLQRRLILLSAGNRPFREAFEPLLDRAPQAKLQAMLDHLETPHSPAQAPRSNWVRSNILRAVAAALLFTVGVGVGWQMPALIQNMRDRTLVQTASDDDDWRQIVAEYLSLYTSETLASIPDDAAAREQEVATVGAKMGMVLSPQKVTLPSLPLKRAQLFEYDRKPLGQIAYLDPVSGPIALCIIADDRADAEPRTEQRLGFNIVYWSRGRHSFMLLGRATLPHLQKLADEFSDRLSG
jgi:anti-sigma factor RsiW